MQQVQTDIDFVEINYDTIKKKIKNFLPYTVFLILTLIDLLR